MDYFDLGTHTRTISTTSPEAQRWFDLGLNWCFAFNQEEGVRCFQRSLDADPDCVMAHWGVAYGSGPFYNLAWREFGELEAAAAITRARHHIERAQSLAAAATTIENALVAAMATRFQQPHPVPLPEYDRWDDDYAAALRRLYHRYPDDPDIAALFVEALITRTPRRLWNVKTGCPAPGSDVLEAVAACERAIAQADAAGRSPHPAMVHLHIHALEMSNEPQRAMRSADTLATLCPDAGHMNHMPGHIYVLCGDYARAKTVSERAIVSDEAYAPHAGPMDFYITARCHDLHLMMFTCMFLGQLAPARAAADHIRRILTPDIIGVQNRPKLAMTSEGYWSMKTHVLVRFGRWHEILDEPPPPDPVLYPVSTAMHHYARGVAQASLKNIAAAEQERAHFHECRARMPAGRRFLGNPALTTLAVGEAMLDGELEYHRGNHAIAYDHLRESVRRDDALAYTEPWAWMHPPRHALAALLLEQDHAIEAEQVYRDDLGLGSTIQRCTKHPDNVWSLHGLVECLQRRDDTVELPALRRKLTAALALADIPITSSCMCRTEPAPPTRNASACCA